MKDTEEVTYPRKISREIKSIIGESISWKYAGKVCNELLEAKILSPTQVYARRRGITNGYKLNQNYNAFIGIANRYLGTSQQLIFMKSKYTQKLLHNESNIRRIIENIHDFKKSPSADKFRYIMELIAVSPTALNQLLSLEKLPKSVGKLNDNDFIEWLDIVLISGVILDAQTIGDLSNPNVIEVRGKMEVIFGSLEDAYTIKFEYPHKWESAEWTDVKGSIDRTTKYWKTKRRRKRGEHTKQ